MTKGKIHIGCSGWNYNHWKGRFYPDELRQKDWFEHYSRFFATVEINNTFYHLPTAKTFGDWKRQAPKRFVYAVKVNRYITHMKKLKDAREPLRKFLEMVRLLGEQLGPLLYQLPPNWRANIERLESFLRLLPRDLTHVFEFRDPTWHSKDVFSLLARYNVAFCTHDMRGLNVLRTAVGPIAYVRFHGAQEKYRGGYPEPTLRSWARWIQGEASEGRDVFVYFNNDIDAHAVYDAQLLIQKISR